jgi:long-chain acyl-CoA synthetase
MGITFVSAYTEHSTGRTMESEDAPTMDVIAADEAGTLPRLFARRCNRTPHAEAYRQFDRARGRWTSRTWHEMQVMVRQWQAALAQEGLDPGDRVAVLLDNSIEWVCFDMAAQGLGLVPVPLYTTDNPESIAYILADCAARMLLVGDFAQWQSIVPLRSRFPLLGRVLCATTGRDAAPAADRTLTFLDQWLLSGGEAPVPPAAGTDALATIVYTSGTTGRPKGVMLSHRNILSNAQAVLQLVEGYREDLYLSFLPLSHAFERTVGYYLPMMAGSTVAFARSVSQLPEDLLAVRPTVLVSVPRIYERVYGQLQHRLARGGWPARALFGWAERIGWQRFEAAQHRGAGPQALSRPVWPLLRRAVADPVLARLGGRVRIAVSGGAPLAPRVARCFIGLGLPLLQGYGLTEAGPVVTSNTLDNNVPESVGMALPGVALKLGDRDELLVKGPNVMLGYWNRPEQTRGTIDPKGWLHTGDVARIDADGRVFIVGRLKEILVLSTGEKVPPADLELAITADPMFEQAMVVGESMPYVVALLVLNGAAWLEFASTLGLDGRDPRTLGAPEATGAVLRRIASLLRSYPVHAQVRRVWLTLQAWSVEQGLITPTLKLRRPELELRHRHAIRELYAGHDVPVS